MDFKHFDFSIPTSQHWLKRKSVAGTNNDSCRLCSEPIDWYLGWWWWWWWWWWWMMDDGWWMMIDDWWWMMMPNHFHLPLGSHCRRRTPGGLARQCHLATQFPAMKSHGSFSASRLTIVSRSLVCWQPTAWKVPKMPQFSPKLSFVVLYVGNLQRGRSTGCFKLVLCSAVC